MSKSQDTVTLVITVQLIAELVDGVRRCTCGAFDKEHVVTVMTFTLTVHDCVFEPGASLRKLRRMLSIALDSSLDHAPSRNVIATPKPRLFAAEATPSQMPAISIFRQ